MANATATASALYDVTVRHRRAEPGHTVRHRLRLAYLDLDEIDDVVRRRPGWSTRPAPVWFRRRDYLDGTDRPLGEAVADLVGDRLGRRPEGPVRILTQLRTLGWLFNPMTAYYGFGADGRTLDWLAIEITNTPWHQRSWYVLDADQVSGRGTPYAKDFHVSPFLPMDLRYRTRATAPGERLALRFELDAPGPDGRRRVFDADLTGQRVPIDAPVRARDVVRAAGQTVGVSAGIYAHALALRLRGATFHPHPDRRAGREAGPVIGATPSTPHHPAA